MARTSQPTTIQDSGSAVHNAAAADAAPRQLAAGNMNPRHVARLGLASESVIESRCESGCADFGNARGSNSPRIQNAIAASPKTAVFAGRWLGSGKLSRNEASGKTWW